VKWVLWLFRQVKVYKKPVVAILSTGNEIVDLHADVASTGSDLKSGWGGIFDTNRPSLQVALEGLGYEVVDLWIVPDSIQAHVTALQKGLQNADPAYHGGDVNGSYGFT